MYPDHSARACQQGRDYVLSQIVTLPQPLRFLASICPRMIQNPIAEVIRRYYLKKESVTCQLWTLSDLLREQKIPRVDLLKMIGLLLDHLTPALCEAVFQRHRTTERTRTWTFYAVNLFWTAMIVRHPLAL